MTTMLRDRRAPSATPRPDRALRPGEAIVTSSMLVLPIDWVEPGPNVRGAEVGDVSELAVSISRIGQQEPIIVARLTDTRFQIIEGHRRRKAIILAGRTHVDAVLRSMPSARDRIVRQLAMHTHSKPFEPIAEAKALHELMWVHGLSRDEIAVRVGRGPIWVRDRLALLQLSEDEQAAVSRRALPLGVALGVVRERRDDRDGRPIRVGGGAATPRRRDQHFTNAHPLAAAARARCRAGGAEHRSQFQLGGVACGACWEHTIRADATGAGQS